MPEWSRDRTVKVWDVRGENDLILGGPRDGSAVAFSADGRQLASSTSKGVIFLRDARTCETLFTLQGHMGFVNELAFSPDGSRIVSAGDDHTVRLWDTRTGAEVAVLRGHTSWVRGIAFSPDGTRLASTGWDGALKLWDAQTQEEIKTLKGHRGGLYCVAFSPDGSRLASVSSDRTVKLWDARSGSEIRTFTGHTGVVRSVAFGPHGERLATGGYDTKARVWDVASGKQLATTSVPSGGVFGLAFSPDGKRIATVGSDKALKLFDAFSGQEIMHLNVGYSRRVAYSADGARLAVILNTGRVRIFDAPQKQETTILSGHTDTVTSVTFSPDGLRIYSESELEKLVWDIATLRKIQDASWEPPSVTTLTSPDGRWYVTFESKNIVLVDREFKNAPDEKAWRGAKASFDPFWHQIQANATTMADNWYAAAFHYAWLLKHEPDSLAHYLGLQSSYRRLAARDQAAVEALSRVADVTGHHHGAFFIQQKKGVVTTFSATPFRSAEKPTKSATNGSGSNDALYFEGASYVDLGQLPFCETSFAVEGWIKPDLSPPDSTSSRAIFTLKSGETDTALAAEVYTDGRLRVMHRNPPAPEGGIDLFSQTKMTDGKWHHVAVVRDDDQKLHLSIDGSLEASSQEAATDFGDAPYPVFLGMNHEKHPRYFKGLMHDVRFWNDARTKDEVQRNLHAHIDPRSQGLVAAYDFSQAAGPAPSQPPVTNLYLAPIVREALKIQR